MSDTKLNPIDSPHPNHDHDWKALKRFGLFTICMIAVVMLSVWIYAKVALPIIVSLFFAYLVSPWVDYLETRKMSRSVASAVILIFVMVSVAIIAIQVGPRIYDQLIDLIQKVPALVDSMMKSGLSTLREVIKDSGFKDSGALDRSLRGFNIMEQAVNRFQVAVDRVWSTGANIMSLLFSSLLVPFITFFAVSEKPRLLQFLRKLTPRDSRPYFKKLFDSLDETMKAVVRGHIKVALTLAALYSIGFTAIGLSAGVAIGIAAGVCRVIPYVDAIVGSILGITYVFSTGMPPAKIFAVLGVIGLVQVLDGAIITPKLIGSRVGLHPAVVILTVIAGSYHFGFLGVLLAIPVAAAVKTIFKLILPIYRDSKWFRNNS